MHYIGGLSVADIAKNLDVPEGTVKRRLHDGRQKMKKEKITAREAEDFTPMRVKLSWTGNMMSMDMFKFTGNRLVQEIIACAYRKPVTLEEIGSEIGIPVYYIEDLIEEAVEREILICENGKYITDAYLDYPEDVEAREERAEKVAKDNRELFIELHKNVESTVNDIITSNMSERARMKMHRFFFIETLQYIIRFFSQKNGWKSANPKRKDGGSWLLLGSVSPLGYERKSKYSLGGHRATGNDNYMLHEFDTPFYDNNCRFYNIEWINSMSALLYSIYSGEDPISNGVNAGMIEKMEYFRNCGLFTADNQVDIAVLKESEYNAAEEKCKALAEKAMLILEDSLTAWQKDIIADVPKHIPKATADIAKRLAFDGFEMAVSFDLINAGIHLRNADYCCPPAVLVVR